MVDGVTKVNVDQGIPIPDEAHCNQKKWKYPFNILRVTDSFFVPMPFEKNRRVILNKIGSVRSACVTYNKSQSASENHIKLVWLEKEEGGVFGIRFWRKNNI